MNNLRYICFAISVCFCLAANTWQGLFAQAPQQVLTERVRATGLVLDDATGQPIQGISISLPGISAGVTNNEGRFSILVPDYDVELLISGLGYKQKRVTLRGQPSVTVRLFDETMSTVYEDILTPLGDTPDNHLTFSVAQLADDNSTNTSLSADELLQGRVPGLNAITRSGAQNVGTNMFLHGFNSIYTNARPLLVIDGMTLDNISAGLSLIDGYISTPLTMINVRDIERISVIKDATALYGTKGANGVILIETIRGKNPETHIDLFASAGVNLKPSAIPMLDERQAKNYLADIYKSRGYSNSQVQQLPFMDSRKPVLQPWGYEGNTDYYRYNQKTDWQDEMYMQGLKQNYMLRITGGDNIALYAISLGFLQNDGVVRGNNMNRFTSRINSDINFSQKLKVQTSLNFVFSEKNISQEGNASYLNPIYSSLVKMPFLSSNQIDEQNVSSPLLEPVDIFGAANPETVVSGITQKNKSQAFSGSINLSYNVWKDLTVSTNFGIRFAKEVEDVYHPTDGIPYADLPTSEVTNELQSRIERTQTVFDETRAVYKFALPRQQSLVATVGFRYLQTTVEDDWGKGHNSTSNSFTSMQYALNTLRLAGGAKGEWRWVAMYANAGYSIRNKYFVNATASFDASSRYGAKTGKFQAFPSVSAAWLISSERFMDRARWVDLLKIRASYTIVGNDDIGNYTARRYYQSQNLLGNYGLVRGNIVNDKLAPEKVHKLNGGIDMALFNERLSLSADLYRSETRDLITYSTITPYSGYNTYINNDGRMRNKGVDLSVSGRLLNKNTWKLDMSLTLSHYRNKVTRLSGDSYITEVADGNILTSVGRPLGLFYGYRTDGVYATQAQADADGLSIRSGLLDIPFGAGDMRFVDQNNDKYIDEKDMVVIGDPNPDIFGGFQGRLQYRRFSLSARFTYSLGNDIYNYTRRVLESMDGFNNQTRAVANRWKYEGQRTDIPRAMYGDPMGNSRFSDRWIEDGSYLKIKNITLSYDLPVRSRTFTGLQIYVSAENIHTWTRYKGYDPEFSASTNPLGYGIDSFITPQPTTFHFGIKLGL